MKIEKYMIELTILEASENIEKYQRETRAWRDKRIVRKFIKTSYLVLKRKKNSQHFSRPSTKHMLFCWRCSCPSLVRVSKYIKKLKEN
jgi:hypothetical protein